MLAFVIFGWLMCALLAAVVGQSKGRGTEGAVLGLFFGVLGLIAICGMRPAERPAPWQPPSSGDRVA
jgi:hypothetical protein